MFKFKLLRRLVVKHKYQLMLTYSLFSIEMLGSLLRFYFFGEAVNDLIKGSYRGLIILILVHIAYLVVGTIRHINDTKTYSAIYTSLVTKFLSRRFKQMEVSKLSAHSTLAREFVDFLEHDLVYVIEAAYNIIGSLVILCFYDSIIVAICLSILLPVLAISYFYGKKMNWLNQQKNDELENQVDIIATGNNATIKSHYNSLRKWQIKISNKEAYNFGVMELLVLVVIAGSLLLSKSMHSPALLAGSLFGIYSYILKFTSGLDTIPYIVQRLSSIRDIARRIELTKDDMEDGNNANILLPKPFNLVNIPVIIEN